MVPRWIHVEKIPCNYEYIAAAVQEPAISTFRKIYFMKKIMFILKILKQEKMDIAASCMAVTICDLKQRSLETRRSFFQYVPESSANRRPQIEAPRHFY